jgi:fucose 4-O-acetylase-like acetyltransferase
MIIDTNRIRWIDIFKAITIILVVIGHATGKFNMFIYQFHMAAFFFISGYTNNIKNNSLLYTIFYKFSTVVLPFITIFFIGLVIEGAMFYSNVHGVVLGGEFIGFKNTITQFMLHGNNYLLWMGACWFILALYGVTIVQKTLFILSNNKINWLYFSFTLILFIFGYHLSKLDKHIQIGIFSIDLIFISQFYFFIGYITKEIKILEKFRKNNVILVFLLIVTITFIYYFGIINPTTVDYPSRRFGNILLDALAAVNGTLFIYSISNLIDRIQYRVINFLIYCGKNSMGILFFHFVFFKVAFYILYVLNIVNFNYITNLIPTHDIGNQYWIFFTAVSITLSIIFWRLLCKVKFIRLFIGQEKDLYKHIFRKLNLENRNRPSIFIEIKNNLKKISEGIISIRDIVYSNKLISFSSIIIILICSSPLFKQGIILNDELQAKFRRMDGFISSMHKGIEIELYQGRPMRFMAAINNSMGFMNTNIYVYKSIQIFVLLCTIALFSFFISKLINNKRFGLFVGVLMLIYLPVTFEHAVPNAFITLTLIPMIWLILSFLVYISYIEKGNKSKLVISMFLFYSSMLGYEFIVTYVLVYPIIYLIKAKNYDFTLKMIIKENIIPCLVGLSYIIMIFVTQSFFKTNYSGVSIKFVSIRSSYEIIKTLFKSSLPGYYLFNGKYQYLFNIYNNKLNILENFINLNSFLLAVALIIVLIFTLFSVKKRNIGKVVLLKDIYVIFVGLIYMIIPALPISISALYQGNVNESNFTSLPVNFYLYCAGIFILCFIIWRTLQYVKYKQITILIIILITIYAIPIHSMNLVMAQKQNTNYNRLLSIEKLMDTNLIKRLNYQSIEANDFYATKDSLSIHEGYWSNYAQLKDLNISFLNSKNDEKSTDSPIRIILQDDDKFVLISDKELAVASLKKIDGIKPVKITESKYMIAEFSNAIFDKGFFVYNYLLPSDSSDFLIKNPNDDAFSSISISVGTDLLTANKIEGYLEDGWVEPSSQIEIHTKENGIIKIEGYYPFDITGNETGEFYVNGEKIKNFTIESNSFSFDVSTLPNSPVILEIICNFEIKPTTMDIRNLAFIIINITGQ